VLQGHFTQSTQKHCTSFGTKGCRLAITGAPARGGQGGQLPTLEKIRVGIYESLSENFEAMVSQ